MASLTNMTTNSPAELVGRHVLRSFGRHGVHKGTIVSYDDDVELTFRIEYQDGDFEDLSQEDVEATLVEVPVSGQKKLVRVGARARRRAKDRDHSDSDYLEVTGDDSDVVGPSSSQATTQPFESQVSQEAPQLLPTVVTEARPRPTRQRSSTTARLSSNSTLWIPSVCPLSICVHYNAVDRGLCAQALREHHTVLERAMGRVFPRFKWGKSHYLQVLFFVILLRYNISIFNVRTTSFRTLRNWVEMAVANSDVFPL